MRTSWFPVQSHPRPKCFVFSIKMKNVPEAIRTSMCLGTRPPSLLYSQGPHSRWPWTKGGGWCPLLTSEAGPLSAPGQENVTNSWHRLCTTKQQTARENKGRRWGGGEGEREEREREMVKTWTSRQVKALWQSNALASAPILADVKLGTLMLGLSN